jgi:glycosyltransferase involved in cell wall biosynthesis
MHRFKELQKRLAGCAGGTARLVDPYSADAIAEGICKIMRDSELAQSLRQKGLIRAKQFTWRNSSS